jgi:hypothetical protein
MRCDEFNVEFAREANWGGENEKPVNKIAEIRAKVFLSNVPDCFKTPEVGVDPDGSIALDWIFENGNYLSLSISNTNYICYAWRTNDDGGYNCVEYLNYQIPNIIKSHLETLSN